MPVLYHLWPKEDISIESLRGHYHGVSTGAVLANHIGNTGLRIFGKFLLNVLYRSKVGKGLVGTVEVIF
jgi:hypothetical protein